MKNVMFENKTVPFSFGIAKTLSPTPHFHKDIEIIYVISGTSSVCVDRKRDVLTSGDFFISFPNQIHYYEGSQTGEYLLVIFSPDILFELKDTLYRSIPGENILHHTESRSFVHLLMKARNTGGAYHQTARAGLLNQAMAEILSELTLLARARTDHSTLQEILHYCASNFADEITLDTVANALRISKFHISHLMNEQLGLSFVTYLNQLRIINACELLEDTDKTMAEISESVGFGSIRSFNRAFQKMMTMSPSQYRNRAKSNTDAT